MGAPGDLKWSNRVLDSIGRVCASVFPPKRRSAPPTAWVLASKRGGNSEKADAERTTCRLRQRGGETRRPSAEKKRIQAAGNSRLSAPLARDPPGTGGAYGAKLQVTHTAPRVTERSCRPLSTRSARQIPRCARSSSPPSISCRGATGRYRPVRPREPRHRRGRTGS